MARRANPESGRTSLDLPPETKAFLLRLCEQEGKSMASVIGDALSLYDRWLEQIKATLPDVPSPSGEATTGSRGGRKAKGSPGPSPLRRRR